MSSAGQPRVAYFAVPLDNPLTLSLSVTSANVPLEVDANYELWASVDCFIKFGNSAVVALTTSHPLTAKIWKHVRVHTFPNGDPYIAGIVSSGTGTLFLSKIAVREVSSTPNN
jgi:hypothetical protein